MRIESGTTILLTGASGGIGTFIAGILAPRRVRLALVAYPGTGVEDLQETVERCGSKAMSLVTDLRDPAARVEMHAELERRFGPVQILINNAGVEFTKRYHELSEQEVRDVLNVNLEAPMMLTRMVLPGMLARGKGHIINISSLAGKSSPALQEPYAATKAALAAFTMSLRASYAGSGVSASVIVPGFVEAGIYARLKERSGRTAPWLLAGCRPEKVAEAVVRAIENNTPEIIVNRYPLRPALALAALWPRAGEWIADRIGVHHFFVSVLEAEKNKANLSGSPARRPTEAANN